MVKIFLKQRNGDSSFIGMKSKGFTHRVRSNFPLYADRFCGTMDNAVSLLTRDGLFRFRGLE